MKIYFCKVSLAFLATALIFLTLATRDVSAIDGKLYQAGKIPIAQLNGSFKEMGRQYGSLLKPQINSFYQKAIVENFPSGPKMTRQQILDYAKTNYDKYPSRIKELFNGMAETSGLDTDKLMLLDQYPLLTEIVKTGGCTTISAWGSYTGGNPLVFAKNEDWLPYFQNFNDSLVVVVYNPDDGSRSVASVCNAGQVSTMNEMNDAGLALAEQYVPQWGEVTNPSDMPFYVKLLSLFLDSPNFVTFDAGIRNYRPPFNSVINVADANKGFSYEITNSESKQRAAQPDGLLVAANHFVDSSWKIPANITSSGDWTESVGRYNNLIALGEKYKGTINATVLKQILDTPKSQGGATFVDDPGFLTIFQYVAIPAELTLWLKAPGYQDWVEVKLGNLFKSMNTQSALDIGHIGNDLKFNISCAQYQGNRYQFSLVYSPAPTDSNIWTLDIASFKQFENSSVACLVLGNDLKLNLYGEYGGIVYSFSMNYTPTPNDPLIWKMDVSTLKAK